MSAEARALAGASDAARITRTAVIVTPPRASAASAPRDGRAASHAASTDSAAASARAMRGSRSNGYGRTFTRAFCRKLGRANQPGTLLSYIVPPEVSVHERRL